ncbi:hypothetical protein JCM19274_2776 [Algibacter lectus]|uniref:Uncharacterized protein n=1 Tax=Algibacter lectus TaxID=221126 RepID=A0A090WY97_9FLAO|nr:hypothetical protein [Algibacter lectus]GAL82065.1 hypothetical protein JCM19274_2776 [Algibacter lectus]
MGQCYFLIKIYPPTDPDKLWSCPPAIKVSSPKKDKAITNVISNANRETFSLKVENASKIKKGDWVILKMQNNSKDLITQDIQPLKLEPKWTSIIEKGVVVNERHQVANVKGSTITFVEPIHYKIQSKHNWSLSTFEHLTHVGFEKMTFEGNWTKDFKHHRSAQDDGGWSILGISDAVTHGLKIVPLKTLIMLLILVTQQLAQQ